MSEIDFKYSDCDKYSVELAELYTYSEMEDFALNYEVFCKYVEDKKVLKFFWILHIYLAFE